MFGPETDLQTVSGVRQAIRMRQEGYFTLLIYSRDQQKIWVDVTLSVVHNDRSNVAQMVAVINDISERVTHEKELEQAKKAAEQANEAKSLFLANMSHEIRTPLTAILGCADALYPALTTAEQQEVLQVIRGQGRLLMGVLNDVLDLSKIEAGKLDITCEQCSIGKIVNEVTSLMQPSAMEKHIQLQCVYDGKIPAMIRSDPTRIRQILLNLVSNAIKFTCEGGVIVRCTCDTKNSSAVVRVTVEDTGVGVSEADLREIFSAFTQASSTKLLHAGGTGLGLTISQRLASMLGGQIEAESRLGEGSRFAFVLPIGSPESHVFIDPAMLETPTIGLDMAQQQLRLRRVLIVEDTKSIQFMLRKMLESISDNVVVVGNGAEALQVVEDDTDFDLILMDMQMPVMTGFEAAQELRSKNVHTPIVALTAGTLAGDREKCLCAGCNDYVSKPVEFEKLVDAIRRCTKPLDARLEVQDQNGFPL